MKIIGGLLGLGACVVGLIYNELDYAILGFLLLIHLQVEELGKEIKKRAGVQP